MKVSNVDIDSHSGFCGGVIRAIGKAEAYLDANPGKSLWSLGQIVHNEAELSRLGAKGLKPIGKDDMAKVPAGGKLMIRAHGEPPQTYARIRELGIDAIDCTCPVVLRLQKNIREAWARVRPLGGQVVIFGKVGHAEVLGLVGQTHGEAVVVESLDMLKAALAEGRIRLGVPLEIFSQTTKSPSEYAEICHYLSAAISGADDDSDSDADADSGAGARMNAGARAGAGGLTIHDTICRQVASRHADLSEFARSHDIILFVSGSGSSNGKVLCELCRAVNPRTWHITEPSAINPSWFHPGDNVGICGATSTPKWLLEEAAAAVRALQL